MSKPTRNLIGQHLLTVLLAALVTAGVAAPATAAAQAPPAGDPVPPCDPATEPCEDSLPDSEAIADPAAEDEAGMSDPDFEGGPQAAVEEDSAIEASADEVFTPGDEISEDYPIPLPSDI